MVISMCLMFARWTPSITNCLSPASAADDLCAGKTLAISPRRPKLGQLAVNWNFHLPITFLQEFKAQQKTNNVCCLLWTMVWYRCNTSSTTFGRRCRAFLAWFFAFFVFERLQSKMKSTDNKTHVGIQLQAAAKLAEPIKRCRSQTLCERRAAVFQLLSYRSWKASDKKQFVLFASDYGSILHSVDSVGHSWWRPL